jgi:release factor glutamine methyltransferase
MAVRRLAAAGVPEPRADAEVLLGFVLGTSRAGVIAAGRDRVSPVLAARFDALVARREAREPVAYIVGEREFWSLAFVVSPAVLIPRPETELVVETALAVAPSARRILDVGTGSGAIAIALAQERPSAFVVASDRMPAALAVARANVARLGARVACLGADLGSALRDRAFDLVVSNPPYCVRGAVEQPEVRDWEPPSALYGGDDGLDVVRGLVCDAGRLLVADGWLVMEIGTGQAAGVVAVLAMDGRWDRPRIARDPAGIERVVAVRRLAGC